MRQGVSRWIGVLMLLALLLGGCAAGPSPTSTAEPPRSFQEKQGPTGGNGGGGY